MRLLLISPLFALQISSKMTSDSTNSLARRGRGRALRLRRLPAFPVEILGLIFEHLAPSPDSALYSFPHDLARCCLVSQAFRLAATPFFYSAVRVRLGRTSDQSKKSRERWISAITSTLDSLKHHTRSLIVSHPTPDGSLIALLLPLFPRLTSLQLVGFSKNETVLEQTLFSLVASAAPSRLTRLKVVCDVVAGEACSERLKGLLRAAGNLKELELGLVVKPVWRVRNDLLRCCLRRLSLGAHAQATLLPLSVTSTASLVDLKLNLKTGWQPTPSFSLGSFQQLATVHLDQPKTSVLQPLVDQLSTIRTLRQVIILDGSGPRLADIGFARLPPSLTVLTLDLPIHSSEIFRLAWKPEFDKCKITWRDAGKAWSDSDSNVVKQMVLARERRNEGKEWAATATARAFEK